MFPNNLASNGGGVAATGNATIVFPDDISIQENMALSSGNDVQADEGCKISNLQESYLLNSSAVVWYRRSCVVCKTLAGTGFCQVCPPLIYSFNLSFGPCRPCPSNAVCEGGSQLTPAADFWNSTRCSTQLHACPRKGVCFANDTCAPGYTGNVCMGAARSAMVLTATSSVVYVHLEVLY